MNRYAAVFDSGLGGLAVLKALKAAYPEQKFVFLADNKQLPLGDKTREQIRTVSVAGARVLVSQEGECGALVIACGTSSSYACGAIGRAVSVPLIEIIAPTVEYLFAEASPKSVGVLATAASIASGRYQEEILRRAPPCRVFQKAAPALVPLIEGGAEGALQKQIEEELSFFPEDTEAFILGCTHYALIKESVQKLRPGAFVMDPSPAVIQAFTPYAYPGGGEDLFLCTQKDLSWEERSSRLMGTPLFWREIRVDYGK